MNIKPGIIFIWAGTHASIPAGWERVTSMDDKYPKGTADATNPNTTGGNATHTHTSPSHTHTMNSHTHTITIGAGSGGSGITDTGSDGAHGNHTHSSVTSGAIASDSVSSTAVTYGAVSNNPPYHKVIYITPTSATNTLPTGVISLADAEVDGLDICDGAGSTPNLVDKYLLGAGTGADAGATGGSTTNTHNINHTHTTSHAHAASGASGGASGTVNSTVSGNSGLHQNHTHTVTLPAATPTIGSGDTINLVTAETVEPAYTKLLALRAPSNTAIPAGTIALWLGLLADIPTNWILCDGSGGTIDMRGRHLKITATPGAVGNTGGSNTHTHASQSHSHAGVAHTHSGTIGHGANTNGDGSGSQSYANSGTTHPISTDSVSLTVQDGSTSADSANNEPPYRTVAFIKFLGGDDATGNFFLVL